MCVYVRGHAVCVLHLCHPLCLHLLHLTNYFTMLSLEAKKWQPVNCVPILTPLSASACPSPSLWCCLDQSSTLAKITKESEMEYTMLLADWRAMASRSAKLLLFLPFVSPSQSVSLSPSLLEEHEALAEHDSVCETRQGVYGCLWSGFYDYCWEKDTFYMTFFGILIQ